VFLVSHPARPELFHANKQPTSTRPKTIGWGRSLLILVPALFGTLGNPAKAGTPEIGEAVAIKPVVKAESSGQSRTIDANAKVFQNDVLITEATASAEIKLLDGTKFAVGPSARITLDKFVYDAQAPPGSISLGMIKGAFRFMTGTSPKPAYEITTPAAAIGIRGTIFDGFVADNGEMVILLHKGALELCSPVSKVCYRHDKVCHIVHVTPEGVFSSPARWDPSLLNGIPVTQAFPFVGQKLLMDPVRRLSYPALIAGTCDFAQNTPQSGSTLTGPSVPVEPLVPIGSLLGPAIVPLILSTEANPPSGE
jgi:FecR protein